MTMNAYDSRAADFDSEDDFDGEDARSERAHRRRVASQVLLDRQRRLRNRPRPQAPARRDAPTARETIASIRELGLETAVDQDSLRRSIERTNKQIRQATYTIAANAALGQALDTFGPDLKDQALARAVLRAGPLLLLSPERTRTGIEGYLLDPRVLGAAAITGMVAVGMFRNRDNDVDDIEFHRPTLTVLSEGGEFAARAVDSKGRDVDAEITWSSADDKVLSVSEKGKFKINGAGVVRVTARAGDRRRGFFIDVKADDPRVDWENAHAGLSKRYDGEGDTATDSPGFHE